MSARHRHHLFQSGMSPVATQVVTETAPSSNDPYPFKLYRGGTETGTGYVGGSQIAEYAALYQAILSYPATAGDCVKVASGTYSPVAFDYFGGGTPGAGVGKAIVGDNPYSSQITDLTIEWLTPGSRPIINHAAVSASNGPAFFVEMGAYCTRLTLRGLDLRGAYGDNTFAFVRSISGFGLCDLRSLTNAIPYVLNVEDCASSGWTFGVVTAQNWKGKVYLRRNMIETAAIESGELSHGCYIGDIEQLYAEGNTLRRPSTLSTSFAGHLLKTRARTNYIEANFFDAHYNGNARALDVPNGGVLTFKGNYAIHGVTAAINASGNQLIEFAAEQSSVIPGGGFVSDTDGRTHSITIEQNTFLDLHNPSNQLVKVFTPLQSHAVTSGTARAATSSPMTIQLAVDAPVIAVGSQVWIITGPGFEGSSGQHYITAWDDTTKTATVGGTWTQGLPDATSTYEVWSPEVTPSITTSDANGSTIRNNVAASATSSIPNGQGAGHFVSVYTNNSQVAVSGLNEAWGWVIADDIAGSPALNEATLIYAGELETTVARTDTKRGHLPTYRPAVGTIANIHLNTIHDVDPCPALNCVYTGVSGAAGIYEWGSGGYIPDIGPFGKITMWGGGHSVYYGTETYSFDMLRRRWVTQGAIAPYGNLPNSGSWNDYGEYDGDQRFPLSPHAYYHFFALGPSLGGGAKGTSVQVVRAACGQGATARFAVSHRFDHDAGQWSRWGDACTLLGLSVVDGRTIPDWGYGPFCLAKERRKFYGTPGVTNCGTAIVSKNIDTGAWALEVTNLPQLFTASSRCPMLYCPPLDALVFIELPQEIDVCGGQPKYTAVPQIWTISCSNFAAGWTQRTASGFTGTLSEGLGCNWAGFKGAFVLYKGLGDKQLYYLTAPATVSGTWVWSTENFTGDDPPVVGQCDNGHFASYNRIAVLEDLKCFAWHATKYDGVSRFTASGPVQLWRPA